MRVEGPLVLATRARALGDVHPAVGLAEQIVYVGRAGTVRARTRGEARRPGGGGVVARQRGVDLEGHLPRTLSVRVGHQHHELIAAVSGHDIGLPTTSLQENTQIHKKLVARLMTVGVVDLFHAVHVDEEDAGRSTIPAQVLGGPLHRQLEVTAVVDARQAVSHRHPVFLLHEPTVVERDGGLDRERAHQRLLVIAEVPRFVIEEGEGAVGGAVALKGRHDDRPALAAASWGRTAEPLGSDVLDGDRVAADHGGPEQRAFKGDHEERPAPVAKPQRLPSDKHIAFQDEKRRSLCGDEATGLREDGRLERR